MLIRFHIIHVALQILIQKGDFDMSNMTSAQDALNAYHKEATAIRNNVGSLSYVVDDFFGNIFINTQERLHAAGYTVKIINFFDLTLSHKYNPLHYCTTESEAFALANKIAELENLENTKDVGFMKYNTENILLSMILVLSQFADQKDKTMTSLIKLLEQGKCDEFGESILDKMFRAKRCGDPNNKCFELYDIFRLARIRTRNSILNATLAPLVIFATEEFKNWLSDDEIELDKFLERPTAIFIIGTPEDIKFPIVDLFTWQFERIIDVQNHIQEEDFPDWIFKEIKNKKEQDSKKVKDQKHSKKRKAKELPKKNTYGSLKVVDEDGWAYF